MKTLRLLRRITVIASLAAALFWLTAITAVAQPRPVDRNVSKTPAPAAPGAFEIEITDGSFVRKGKTVDAYLQNVADLLRERHDGANIVLSPGLPRIRIANLKLRATTLEQELEALRVASGYRFVWNNGNNPQMIDPTTGLPGMGGGMPAVVVAVDPNTGQPLQKKDNQVPLYILSEVPSNMATPSRRVQVFNLTQYFNSLGNGDEESRAKLVEDSLTRIKEVVTTTLQTVDEDHNSIIGFQFHSGANLLVVFGTPDAIEVADKVISAIGPAGGPSAVPGWGMGAAGAMGMGGYRGGGLDPFPNSYVIGPAGAGANTSGKARRAILNKLETIKIDSVRYASLPLSEVVRQLIVESKKRGPQNEGGVNFLINPNQPPTVPNPPPGVPGAAIAPEVIEIGEVIIRIDPPLANVRLVDVLDAIVKVADHPIRYTVTDYAVVFSLRGPESPTGDVPFPGAAPGYNPTP